MADRPGRPIADSALEQALVALGDELSYPPTPDLARCVRARLAAEPGPRRTPWPILLPLRRTAMLAVLVLVIVAGAVLSLSPSARDALARRLWLRGLEISYVPSMNAPPIGTALDLGDRLTLADARSRVAFPVLLPADRVLGQLDEVYVGEPPPGGQLALVWHARPALATAAETGLSVLLTQFRGDTEAGLMGKSLGPGTRLEEVVVNGQLGSWVEGNPHLFVYRDANGRVREETIRLVGNTLVWQQGGLIVRLETALSKDETLRIAASVR